MRECMKHFMSHRQQNTRAVSSCLTSFDLCSVHSIQWKFQGLCTNAYVHV